MGTIRVIARVGEAFGDRVEAGRLLAAQLTELNGHNPLVLGIPRGGVIVAEQVAEAIDGELDIVLTRKLGAPNNPELAVGAVAENGAVVTNELAMRYSGASPAYVEAVKKREQAEIARRAVVFRFVRPRIPLAGRTVILIDDGVATGATMLASLQAARAEGPARLICALPVAPEDALTRLAAHCDELICLRVPSPFGAVGQFYTVFGQTTDVEVVAALRRCMEKVKHESPSA
jgi:predicted phosphoribosyltransferase